MIKVAISPDLEHCVEALAKRRHAELIQILLCNESSSTEEEEELELLRLFLEAADFSKLRAESEKYLIKGEKVRFTIYFNESGLRCELSVI
jgi:hypothetical protein